MKVRVPALIAVTASLLAVMGGTSGAASAPANGPIAFAGLSGGSFEIFRMSSTGRNVHQLTNARNASIFSDWSPDGRWITFDSDRTGHVEVYLMNRFGGQEHRVTHFNRFTGDPSFSPDGSRLVFESSPETACCSNIYTVDVDGTGLHQLTHFKVETFASEPEYSPDGRWIAFMLIPNGGHKRFAIFTMRSNGTDLRRVTRQRLDAAHPSWSPDGSLIVFNDNFQGQTGDIFTIHPDGTGLKRITNVSFKGQVDFRPDFSPDGRKLVFNHLDTIDGAPEAWVMNRNGAGRHRISARGMVAFAPRWGPAVE
jgi:Tol biopolymer transport system component